MKREKFLWPLSQSHHRALMAAKQVRERLSSPAAPAEGVREMAAEVRKLYDEELRLHFWDEEKMLALYEGHMGREEPEPERIRKEHRLLESLMARADRPGLLSFAELLVAHVRFEEDVFFAKVERALGEAEKRALGSLLEQGSAACGNRPA